MDGELVGAYAIECGKYTTKYMIGAGEDFAAFHCPEVVYIFYDADEAGVTFAICTDMAGVAAIEIAASRAGVNGLSGFDQQIT